MSDQMTQPMFPVPLAALRSKLTFEDFRAGDVLKLGDGLKVRTAPLNHPNGATGYHIEHAGKAMCYVTDTEHRPGEPDQNILGLNEGADLVVYDSTSTDDEYPAQVGWGPTPCPEGNPRPD